MVDTRIRRAGLTEQSDVASLVHSRRSNDLDIRGVWDICINSIIITTSKTLATSLTFTIETSPIVSC